MLRFEKWFIIVSFVFLFSGCATTRDRGMHDSSVPIEKQSTLEIHYSLHIIEFNGLRVRWHAGWWAQMVGGNSKSIIKIPAGVHTLVANYSVTDHRGGGSRASGLRITYEFQPGVTYRIYSNVSGRHVSIGIEELKR